MGVAERAHGGRLGDANGTGLAEGWVLEFGLAVGCMYLCGTVRENPWPLKGAALPRASRPVCGGRWLPSLKAMLLLFGDACYDFHASIADLHRRSQCSVVLRGFLLACSDALRCGLAELGGAERARFGSFESLLELAEVHSQRRDESQDAAVATVLQCACQLGWLVMWVLPGRHMAESTPIQSTRLTR